MRLADVCNRQKVSWQTPKRIYILDQSQQPSRMSHVRLSVRLFARVDLRNYKS